MSVAHVTGAARGIGKAIALRLARDGHDVAVSDLPSMAGELKDTRAEIEATGVASVDLTGDVSVRHDVRSLISGTAEALVHSM